MFKKSPSRNQRSKGIKIKHVLQICLLLGVCFWLIYQVKHSHDKRKEFDEKGANTSMKAQSDDVILKFGRKDLPRVQEVSKNYKHEEEEDEDNGVEVENKHDEEQEEKAKRLEEEEREGANKHEEEEQEEGSKHDEEEQEEGSKHDEEEQEDGSKHKEEEQEEASIHEEEEEVQEDEGSKHDDEEQEAEIKDEEVEDEGRGDGDNEVDESEQERADGGIEHEEEFIDEEKEREAEGDDKENEEKEGQEESDNLANDQSHDGGDSNAHEAREEHYKADDASSAVSHDTQIINSEADRLDMENSNDNSTMNVLEQESKAITTEETNGDEKKSELKVDEGKNSEGGSSLNVTYTKENDHETGSSNSENISLPNTTHTTDFIDQASNNTTEVSKETDSKPAEVNIEIPGSLQNGTSAQNTAEDSMVTEEKYKEQANETISNRKQPDSSAVDSSKIENVDSATRDSSNSSANAVSGMSEEIAKINAMADGDSSGSSMTREITDSTQNEKSEGDNESSGTDESADTSSNETVDGGQHDPIDTSDNTLPQEEKDARVDLSTLPDITTEGSNNEDAAAE